MNPDVLPEEYGGNGPKISQTIGKKFLLLKIASFTKLDMFLLQNFGKTK
jgi:hypothetical protein